MAFSTARMITRLASDKTAAFVIPFGKGQLECRHVRRKPLPHQPSYISVYLSSHSGCTMGCKQCHLTANGSTSFKHATLEKYHEQFKVVLEHYDQLVANGEDKAQRASVNLMARGDSFANRYFVNQYADFYQVLKQETDKRGMEIKVNASTIMPNTVRDRDLYDIFGDVPVEIYYSLYSLNPKFRSHWLPNAMNPLAALDKIKAFQEKTKNKITLHWAFIEGHNDDLQELKELARVIRGYNFDGKFNLVRYNPPNNQSREPSEQKLQELLNVMKTDAFTIPTKSKMIQRVGEGEKTMASCGMFFRDGESFHTESD
uniref:Dual-specificity RNA methyltransferase n=1 Tax=Clandestinovirus TaxID=2831644 RepID=A0A8F8KUJ5_9VIRU|nr:dual-specificity RNA methyltransferase [Clandestinovirus]